MSTFEFLRHRPRFGDVALEIRRALDDNGPRWREACVEANAQIDQHNKEDEALIALAEALKGYIEAEVEDRATDREGDSIRYKRARWADVLAKYKAVTQCEQS